MGPCRMMPPRNILKHRKHMFSLIKQGLFHRFTCFGGVSTPHAHACMCVRACVRVRPYVMSLYLSLKQVYIYPYSMYIYRYLRVFLEVLRHVTTLPPSLDDIFRIGSSALIRRGHGISAVGPLKSALAGFHVLFFSKEINRETDFSAIRALATPCPGRRRAGSGIAGRSCGPVCSVAGNRRHSRRSAHRGTPGQCCRAPGSSVSPSWSAGGPASRQQPRPLLCRNPLSSGKKVWHQ